MKNKQWSPYIVGALIGLLSTFCFFVFHKMLGVSTSIVKIAALISSFIDFEHFNENAYYTEEFNNKAWVDWQMALVIGIFIGALIVRGKTANPMTIWHQKLGDSQGKRYLGAFLGGIFVLFGARLAGGCTSGMAISDGSQLALASWPFMFGIFVTGIPTAFLLYHKRSAE